MQNSTAKLNIDHLIQLGFKTSTMSDKWKTIFKKSPYGYCLGCNNQIRITAPISKFLKIHFNVKKYIPEVHWIFDFELYFENVENIEQCKTYITTLSNKQKQNHIYPCCYRCWNIATVENKNYHTDSVMEYYEKFKLENPEFINWSQIECETEEQKLAKLQYQYDYMKDWCTMVNICDYTDNGRKLCGKKNGSCIHTNSQLQLEQQLQQEHQQQVQQLQQEHQQHVQHQQQVQQNQQINQQVQTMQE